MTQKSLRLRSLCPLSPAQGSLRCPYRRDTLYQLSRLRKGRLSHTRKEKASCSTLNPRSRSDPISASTHLRSQFKPCSCSRDTITTKFSNCIPERPCYTDIWGSSATWIPARHGIRGIWPARPRYDACPRGTHGDGATSRQINR